MRKYGRQGLTLLFQRVEIQTDDDFDDGDKKKKAKKKKKKKGTRIVDGRGIQSALNSTRTKSAAVKAK